MAKHTEHHRKIALDLAAAGIAVFPFKATIKTDPVTGAVSCEKLPLVKWRDEATCDPIIINQWWSWRPTALIGIEMSLCRLVVLDPDRHNPKIDGMWNFHLLCQEHGYEPDTVVVNTPAGQHYFFLQPDGEPLDNSAGSLPAGIDVRGDGGWIAAPGCIRPDGKKYEPMAGGLELADAFKRGLIPVLPPWLENVIRAPAMDMTYAKNGNNGAGHGTVAHVATIAEPTERDAVYARQALRGAAADLAESPEGQRNKTLNDKAYHIGRQVGAGRIEADDVVEKLTEAGLAAGLPAHEIRKTIKSGLDDGIKKPAEPLQSNTATATDDGEPVQLTRALPPADPFPIDALPPKMVNGVNAIQAYTLAPVGLCAQAVIAAATLGAQGHFDVILPTGETKPISENFISIAETGERKTSVDNRALVPVRDRQDALTRAYEREIKIYCNKRDAYAAERKKILSDKKTDYAAKEAKLQALPEMQEPLTPMLTCSEPTPEGLAKLLIGNQPSVGVFNAEGGSFVGGHGLKEENKLKTASVFSQMWDNGAVDRVRAGDGYHAIRGRRIAVHLAMQPYVASMVFADALLVAQGLIARLLPVAPDSLQGERYWRDVEPEDIEALNNFQATLSSLFKKELNIKRGTRNELAPKALPLTKAATKRWIKYSDAVEARLKPGGQFRPIAGFAAKAAEHAARLAATLCAFQNADAEIIDVDDLERAIKLVEHYAHTHLRLQGTSQVNIELQEAEHLIKWLNEVWVKEHGDYISLTDILQVGPNSIRDSDKAKRLMAILTDHNWVGVHNKPQEIRRKRRRKSWLIKKRILSVATATAVTVATPIEGDTIKQ